MTNDPHPRPDLHYTDPLLARVYDATCGWSDDLDFYLSLATRPTMRVLDLGCGTGSLCDAFAARGHAVTGLDPSASMLDVARTKSHAANVRWVEAFAQDFALDGRFELVTMTGHAFQTLRLDDDVASLFRSVARHLTPDGVFAFESRNPVVDWRAEWDGRRETHDSPFGEIRCSIRVTEVAGETLSFEQTYAFERETRVSASTLRFMDAARVGSLLEASGLGTVRLHGGWAREPFVPDRSREMIFETGPAARLDPPRGDRDRNRST